MDASGDAHTLTGCVEITPNYMPTTLAGNYIVSESVTYTSKVTLSGNTTIILANGKTMSIGTEAAPLGGDNAIYASGTNSLTIYGQSLDAATAGSLEVYSTGSAAVKLYDGSYAQHSGNVVVSRSGGSNNNYAINAGGSVTIDGGKLDASITSEGSFAINASGNISISGGSVIANATTVNPSADDLAAGSTFYLDAVMNKVLRSLVKKLRDTLTKYADVAIMNVSGLVPEFLYYIRCAGLINRLMEKGCVFCEAQPETEGETSMTAEGFYNLKLAMNMENAKEIVPNDLIFDKNHTVYILTGANRGGKTTITQAVGQLFVLAQGGLFVPAESFRYVPCDCVYTHFPADEDKTMDLGRLGEECVRFKEMFSAATGKSLLLLNETFSTTSFEEGYYIARDSVKALLTKAARTIYNTHMHKLGEDAGDFSLENTGAGAASLIMKTEDGRRSFKVALARPEGSSYAKDIAEKYGVTYDMLIASE